MDGCRRVKAGFKQHDCISSPVIFIATFTGDAMRSVFARLLAVLFGIALFSSTVFAQEIIRLSTTTSTENSRLLDFLLPVFEAQTKTRVQVISVGTGKALELAKNGDVDVTLVHARPLEDRFVADGHGVYRHDVMHNDFIIVGPTSDPAAVRGMSNVSAALEKIVETKARFISRGDNSGTDLMEKTYWNELGRKPTGAAYISAGLGMGQVLNMAAELQAYTLTDRATYLAYHAKTGLMVAVEGDRKMFNPYGIIAVNPARHAHVNYKGAMQLIDWITSDAGQQRIAAFRIEGDQVFFPFAAPR
jgi:tungstate transport system substrate-binding protein